MTEQMASPPGWYPDSSGRLQWWDGTTWTGAYADEQPHHAPPSRGKSLASTVVVLAQMVLVTLLQLAWLARFDDAGGVLILMIGPFLGVVIGTALGLGEKRRARQKPKPLIWHAGVAVVIYAGWLLLISANTGGVNSEAILGTAVLGVIGAAAMTASTKVITPELVRG